MTAVQVGSLIVAIVLVSAILSMLALSWVARKSGRLVVSLQAELATAGETAMRGPEPALYRGASGIRSRVKGNGAIVLTERRVLFRKLFGADIEVPLAQLIGVKEDKWFLRAYTGGRLHMILQLKGGDEVGFMVSDHAGWMAVMREGIAARSPA